MAPHLTGTATASVAYAAAMPQGSTPQRIEIPTPDDWHVHLRDGEMLDAVVGYTARRFRTAMVMPNLVPPITSSAAAAAYLDRITTAAAGVETTTDGFDPWIVWYCSPDIDTTDLVEAHGAGTARTVKYYPAGATTNSEAGGTGLSAFVDLFEVMAEHGIRLLVHAESTRPEVDIFDREEAFLVDELAPLCAQIPELAVTVEHVSTAAGISFVHDHPQCAATITPHHLARDRGDLLASGLKPDLYCKPVINSPADRDALVAAATSGDPAFCLGTDSAPHPTSAKYGPTAKAGVFNAAYGLEVVADVFARHDAVDQLAAFVSSNGCAIYGVEPPMGRLVLEHEAVDVELATHLTTATGDDVVLFGTEEASRWTVTNV